MVIKMQKKFFFSIVIAIICGAFLGNLVFQRFQSEEREVFKENNTTYFILEGVYENRSLAENAASKVDTKIIVKEDANYYVYLAITQNEKNKDRLLKIYQDKNIEVSVKEMVIEDSFFLTTLEQMDGLMEKATTNEEIMTINKVVLANYEELILS